ncbi:hypothetical protein ACSNOJ_21650, partial [Streptomyces sp. URMC 128]
MSRRSTRVYKPLSLKRRAWLTIGAVVLSGAGVVTYAVADPPGGSDGASQSRKPAVHTVRLQDKGSGRKGLAKQDTDRFSAVLVTWNDPDARVRGTAEVRTRDLESRRWSGWQKLSADPVQADGAEGERAALRGGTESLWTGDADGVEVRVVNADGTEAGGQPAGMDVRLLDPGTDPKGAIRPAAYAEETPAPTTTEPTAPAETPTAPTE